MADYYVPPLTLQEAILEAADSDEVDNYVYIQESPVVISDQVDIHAGFHSGRRLTIRPNPTMRDPARAVIASIDVGDNGNYRPIFSVANVGHVTFQDLDIVRNITNTYDLLRLDRCTDLTIERCRIGSIWPGTGRPDCTILRINEPVRVIVRNSIFFAYCLHTFRGGIWAELGSGQACSLLLYNNVVADYKDWGIRATGPQGDAFLLLRNNVVVNHPDASAEGVAYFSAVDERMTVESSFNAAFASVGQVEELANEDCQSIAGEEGFLRRARVRVAAAFVEHTWIIDPEWDPNVDFFRLVRGGPLHSEPADAGTNVRMGEPDERDVAVTDDIEKDVRPAGIPLHTDRGADQIRKDDMFLALDLRNKRQYLRYEPLIPTQRLKLIYRAAEIVAGQDKSKNEANEALLDELVSATSELDLLFNHARDFLRGDSAARYPLIALLNHIVKREGIQGGPPSKTKQGRPVEGPDASKGGNPHALGHAMLMPAGLPGGAPCLVPPLRVADIFMGLLRICAEDPRIGGGGGICPDYLMVVGSLVERLNDLEMLYAAAADLIRGKDSRVFPYFEKTLEIMRHSRLEGFRAESRLFPFIFGNPDGIPIALDRPRLFTSPCADEKWAATADAVKCFRELWAGPKYEIQDIINITPDHEQVSRRGCLGDEIEIRGCNLEVLREIVFPGGIQVTEYTMLEDERIRFIVPEDARSGRDRISICIDPGIGECIRFNVCRLAEPGTDHSFEVVWPPAAEFIASGLTVEVLAEGQVEAEACTDITLAIIAENAERAVITDNDGNVIWDSGIGAPRRIDTSELPERDRPPTVNLRDSGTYTYRLEVRNLCGTLYEELHIDIYHAVHLTVSAPEIHAGSSVDLTVGVSCPAPAEGTFVSLTTSDAGALPLPEHVDIPEGERSIIVAVTSAASNCADVEMSGTVPNHRDDQARVLVYDTPAITAVEVAEVRGCSPFSITVRGNCFALGLEGNFVEVSNGGQTFRLDVVGIHFADMADRAHNVSLDVSGDPLPPGDYRVSVISHDLVSEPFDAPFHVSSIRPNILSFTADPTEIAACGETEVHLEWEVENIKSVRILLDNTVIVDKSYGEICTGRSDDALIMVSEPGALVLEAFPLGSGEARRSDPQHLRQRDSGGFSGIRIQNCNVDGATVTVWVFDYTAGTVDNMGDLASSYDEFGTCNGDIVVIDFEDCHLYDIVVVDPTLFGCDPPDPLNPDCWKYKHLYTGDTSGLVASVSLP